MTLVDGVQRSAIEQASRGEPAPSPAAAGAAETSRALIPLKPIERHDAAPDAGRRPSASFLAHLIATDRQLPQTRARRRAAPEEAIAAYAAAITPESVRRRFVVRTA